MNRWHFNYINEVILLFCAKTMSEAELEGVFNLHFLSLGSPPLTRCHIINLVNHKLPGVIFRSCCVTLWWELTTLDTRIPIRCI